MIIGQIGLPGVFVPFGCEDTMSSDCVKSPAQTPDSRKEINETESVFGTAVLTTFVRKFLSIALNQGSQGFARYGFSALESSL